MLHESELYDKRAEESDYKVEQNHQTPELPPRQPLESSEDDGQSNKGSASPQDPVPNSSQGDFNDSPEVANVSQENQQTEGNMQRIMSENSNSYFNDGGSNDGGSPSETRNNSSDSQAKQKHAAKMQKRAATEKKCKCCGTESTPVWRWGGDAKDTLLCNACSLRIRRSNARPSQRGGKVFTDRPSKKQNVGSQNHINVIEPSARQHTGLSKEEVDALRQRLAGFMSQEKERLLSMSDYSDGRSEPIQPWSPGWGTFEMRNVPPYQMNYFSPQGSNSYVEDFQHRQWALWPGDVATANHARPMVAEPLYWEQNDQDIVYMQAQPIV